MNAILQTKMKIIFFFISLLLMYSCSQETKQKIENSNEEKTPRISNELIHTSLFSSQLNRNWNVMIYLPPHYYSDSLKHFDILYLLHGHGGNETSWMGAGEIKSMVDELILKDELEDFIVVMPDGGNSWFVNGVEKMESAIIKDLMPIIQKNYRINERFESTSIGGMSAGGYGSLRFVLKYPHLFQNAILMSPASYFPYPDQTSFARFDVATFRDESGNFSNLKWTNYNYPNYWKTFDKSTNLPHHFYLSVGKKDGFTGIIKAVNEHLPIELNKRKNKLTFEIRNYKGGHEMNVWKQALKKALISIYKKK